MDNSGSFQVALDVMRRRTGVVIPVYLPEGVDRAQGETLLRDNVVAFCAQVADPAHICLSVDGERFSGDVIAELGGELGVSTFVAATNRGKLWAVANGVRCLLEHDPDLRYLAVVDQDGDHFANELLNLVRAAEHMSLSRILVLGARSSAHRPMGFLRGELEELADRILLDALHYRAAVTGRPLHLEFASALGEYPDFHSGYKLFSRATAHDVFLVEPQLAGVSEECYYRHAVEAVMVVEAIERGALLGVVNRSTFNEQPISVFGRLSRSQLTADMIIWPCRRLGVPAPFVRQWLANHIPRLLLGTLAPQGQEELEEIARLVMAAYDSEAGPMQRPLFV